MLLDIVLRTCTRQGVPTHHSLSRICGDDRSLMVQVCLTSLVEAINHAVDPESTIRLFVVDDNSPDLPLLQQILAKCRAPVTLIPSPAIGAEPSALQQFEVGKENGRELIYFVEDDYLHAPTAIVEMLAAYEHFCALSPLRAPVALYPFDCPHRYNPCDVRPNLLYFGNGRYWRTSWATANTVLLHNKTLQEYWTLFYLLATRYPELEERDTINLIWSNGVDSRGAVTLYSPIPSLAVHLTYEDVLPVDARMFDWRTLWNNYVLPTHQESPE